MLKISSLSVVDELWSLANDGRWHTRRALIRKSSFEPDAVIAAIGFLVKYGFARSSRGTGTRIKATRVPSPNTMARLLSFLASEPETDCMRADLDARCAWTTVFCEPKPAANFGEKQL